MSSKCSAGSCAQSAFRDGLCIDHFRTQKPGASPSRLVAAQDEKLSDKDRNTFKGLTRKVYAEQAKWYLNGFWREEGEAQAEDVWTVATKFMELDPKKKDGNELDPVLSSHYLQGINKAMTALELKEALRRIDVDANGLMALLEYLLFKYNRSVLKCLNNPQGGTEEDKRKLDEATARCEQLQKALDDLQVQLTNQKRAERDAKVAENNAHAAEAEARSAERLAKEAEDKLKAAEADARAADADLKRQQDELAAKIKGLETKINNPSTGAVAKGQAVQELAALKGADPLPLRKAKITQEAAVRRVEAERKNAEAERAKAVERRKQSEKDRDAAIAARKAAEEQTKRVEAAVADTEKKAKEANDILEELKKHEGVPHGAIWWMQRQVAEAKKYMPRSRQ